MIPSGRVFNISSGKQKKSFKGSKADDGSLLRVCWTSPHHTACWISVRFRHFKFNIVHMFYRFRWTHLDCMWQPAAQIRISACLTSEPESVWLPSSATLVNTELAVLHLDLFLVLANLWRIGKCFHFFPFLKFFFNWSVKTCKLIVLHCHSELKKQMTPNISGLSEYMWGKMWGKIRLN